MNNRNGTTVRNGYSAQSLRFVTVQAPAANEGVGAALRSAYNAPSHGALPSDMMALLDRLDQV